jgi:hypothetical protein
MVSTRSKGDQIMFVSNVFLLSLMQWVVVRDVILDTAIFLVRWTIHCQELLRRLGDSGLALWSVFTFLSFFPLSLTVRVESMFDLF